MAQSTASSAIALAVTNMMDTPLIGPVAAPDLHVMSFNIRRRMTRPLQRGPDRWERRSPLIQRMLHAERPTIIGVQEALPDQAGFMRHASGENYRSVGFGRNANRRGEGCPIIFDADRLQLLDWAQSALSSTPAIPGSTSWGHRTPRAAVDATFRDRETGIEFRMINTHFDHFSRRSRVSSADQILLLIATASLPAIITGDFNSDVDSLPHAKLMASGAIVDSWDTAKRHVTKAWGTFPNYHDPSLDRKRIDWILVSPTITVRRTAINVTRFDGKWPSDHTPVQAVLTLSR